MANKHPVGRKTQNGIAPETQRHRDAFEFYYALGDFLPMRRKVELLMDEFDVSHMAIYDWKKKYNWDERKKKRDERVQKLIEAQTDNAIVENRKRYLELVELSFKEYAERCEVEGPIKILKTSDLERMIKLALLLAGDVTERSEEIKGAAAYIEGKKKLTEYEDYFAELEDEGEDVEADSEAEGIDSEGDTGQPLHPVEAVPEAGAVSPD